MWLVPIQKLLYQQEFPKDALLLLRFYLCLAACLRLGALYLLALAACRDGSLFGDFFLEFLNSSGSVNQFLLTGVEWMAI